MSERIPQEPKRRSLLTYMTLGAGAFTLGAGIWSLFRTGSSRNITEYSVSLGLADIPAGEHRKLVTVRGPVFVRHLTQAQLQDVDDYIPTARDDKLARNANLPKDAVATLQNRTIPSNNAFVVVWGICPRRGCVPIADTGGYDGWFCPCGGTHFDVLGRARKGPSFQNLSIPFYAVSPKNTLVVFPERVGPSQSEIDELVFGRQEDT